MARSFTMFSCFTFSSTYNNEGKDKILKLYSSDAGGKQEKLSVGNVSDEKLINIIGQLMATYKKCVEGQIEMEPLEHTVIYE